MHGGQYPTGKEANFYRPDPASTIVCVAKWQLPVTFAGWEAGNLITSGGASFKAKNKPASPIYQAYELYNGFAGRSSWDQLAVLEAIEGAERYFKVNNDGQCKVAPDGSNSWVLPPNGLHSYLSINTATGLISDRINTLMLGEAGSQSKR